MINLFVQDPGFSLRGNRQVDGEGQAERDRSNHVDGRRPRRIGQYRKPDRACGVENSDENVDQNEPVPLRQPPARNRSASTPTTSLIWRTPSPCKRSANSCRML